MTHVEPAANGLTQAQRATLTALADTLIPADEYPGAGAAGFLAFLDRNWGDLGTPVQARISAGALVLAQLAAGDAGAIAAGDAGGRMSADFRPGSAAAAQRPTAAVFAALPPPARDSLLSRLDQGDFDDDFPEPGGRWVALLFALVMQSYYADPANGGNRAACSWRMLGFDPAPKRPLAATSAARLQPSNASKLRAEYDAIVVGAGAGGGVVAALLAEAGFDVLLVERGAALTYAEVGRDHLRNHRYPMYGHNTGPALAGHPRILATDGGAQVLRPHQAGWSNNAMTVGGGTRVYGAQAWRFAPEDFRMASRYGVPEGSSLADWPIDYATLAPYYARAEQEIGVCGELGHAWHGPRGGYPLPAPPVSAIGRALRRGADALGWRTAAVPLAVNTAPYLGRPACVQCGMCVGFACPSDSKNGTHNTVIPRALASGRCQLLTNAMAAEVVTDRLGEARGVRLLIDAGGDVIERVAHARVTVLAAGAIETARLLLNSRSRAHPAGIGNLTDQVGRNLQGHIYCGATGLHPTPVQESIGPGPCIATCEFNHDNPGVVGGGMLSNEFIPLPIHFANAFSPTRARWGARGKRELAHAYRHALVVMGPIQEIPNPQARVTVDPLVRDRFGLAVARLSGRVLAANQAPAAMLRERARQWITAAGATAVRAFGGEQFTGLSAGQHQAGTCRMGADPATSVTDRDGRVHGQRALYIADGSLHVTNGGFNPVLTIYANAFRIGEQIVRELRH